MKLRYVVTIDREQDGRFIASVPEVPGAHVYGRTRRQAIARARSALQFYVDTLRCTMPNASDRGCSRRS